MRKKLLTGIGVLVGSAMIGVGGMDGAVVFHEDWSGYETGETAASSADWQMYVGLDSQMVVGLDGSVRGITPNYTGTGASGSPTVGLSEGLSLGEGLSMEFTIKVDANRYTRVGFQNLSSSGGGAMYNLDFAASSVGLNRGSTGHGNVTYSTAGFETPIGQFATFVFEIQTTGEGDIQLRLLQNGQMFAQWTDEAPIDFSQHGVIPFVMFRQPGNTELPYSPWLSEITISSIPEPSHALLLLFGTGLVFMRTRRFCR